MPAVSAVARWPLEIPRQEPQTVVAQHPGALCYRDSPRQTITTKTPHNGAYFHRTLTGAWYVQASLYIRKGRCGALHGEQNGILQPYRLAAGPSARMHPPSEPVGEAPLSPTQQIGQFAELIQHTSAGGPGDRTTGGKKEPLHGETGEASATALRPV